MQLFHTAITVCLAPTLKRRTSVKSIL